MKILLKIKPDIQSAILKGPHYLKIQINQSYFKQYAEIFVKHARILDAIGKLPIADRTLMEMLTVINFDEDYNFWNLAHAADPGFIDRLNRLRERYAHPRDHQISAQSKSTVDWVGDPVDVTTGAFCLETTDLYIDGEPSIELKRSYNSQSTDFGHFGFGWTHAYSNVLTFSHQDNQLPIHATQADGSIIIYTQEPGSGVWKVNIALNPGLGNNGKPTYSQINRWHMAYIEEMGYAPSRVFKHYLDDGSVKTYIEQRLGVSVALPYLESWVDAQGNKLVFEYGKNPNHPDYGQITRISNSTGQFIDIRYNATGWIQSAASSDGRVVHYTQDENDHLISIKLVDGNTIQYKYQKNFLIQEIKANTITLENSYDNTGRVVSQKALFGQSQELEQNARFEYKTHPSGLPDLSVAHVYDPDNNLTQYYFYKGKTYKIMDSLGQEITYTWYITKDTIFNPDTECLEHTTASGHPYCLLETQNKRGLITHYTYDDHGCVTTYTIKGKDLTGTGVQEKSTYYQYEQSEPFRLLEEMLIADNNTQYSKRFSYDQNSLSDNPISITDYVDESLVKKTCITYGTTFPAKGKVIDQSIYDKNNLLLSKIEYTYDVNGRIKSIKT